MADNQRNTLVQIMVVVIVALVGFAIISSLFGFGMMGGGMMGGMMGFGMLFMLLPVIFIIIILYALLDNNRPIYNQQPYYGNVNPMQVLEQRYASGELSREDYFRIKEDIRRK